MMMTPTLLYRIASALLLTMGAGIVLGLIKLRTPPAVSVSGEAGRDVGLAKARVALRVGGKAVAFAGSYGGIVLCLMIYQFLSAYFAWQLGTRVRQAPAQIGMHGWMFCAVQGASLVLGWKSFYPFTRFLSGLVGVLLGWAAGMVG